jgi:hypothetical protein
MSNTIPLMYGCDPPGIEPLLHTPEQEVAESSLLV